MPKESIEWDTALEYALPHKLTEDEKQVIRNNVNLAITTAVAKRDAYLVEEVEKMIADKPQWAFSKDALQKVLSFISTTGSTPNQSLK